MAFTLKSGNKPTFKEMGSSPLKSKAINDAVRNIVEKNLENQKNNERAYGGDKTWKEGSDVASTRTGKSLNELVKMRGKTEKGSSEYNAIQNEINKALGSKVRHEQDKKTVIKDKETKEKMTIKKREGDDTKITTKTSEGVKKVDTKGDESTPTERKRLGKGRIKEGIANLKAKRAKKKEEKKAAKEGGYKNPSKRQVKKAAKEMGWDKDSQAAKEKAFYDKAKPKKVPLKKSKKY